MKPTVVLLLLLKTIAFNHASSVDLYESKKLYVYDWKAKSITGVGDETIQLSGFGLQSQVTLQKSQQSYLAFHMKDLKLGSFNKKLDNFVDEMDIQYNRLQTESQQFNINRLENMFYAEFPQGVFKSIYFGPNEDIAKHNNKKALASLFQLDIRKDGEEFQKGYITHEDSWDGVCDTIYEISNNKDENVLTINKIRSYTNCSVQPHLFHSSVLGEKNEVNDEEYAPIIKDFSELLYKLKKSGDQYIIQSIHSSSGFSVTPFSSNGQTIFTMVNQSLTLAEVVDDPPEFELPSDAEKHETLYHEFNNDKIPYNTKNEDTAHYYDRVFKTNRDDRMVQAKLLYSQLEEALASNKSNLHDFIPQLVKEFQKFDHQDFVTFFENLKSDTSSTAKFVIKILPYVGTNPAIKFMLEMIESGSVSPVATASTLIHRFPFYVKEPSKKLVEVIKNFLEKLEKTEPSKAKKILVPSTILAYGTVLFRGCKKNTFNPHPVDAQQYIPKDACNQYVQELIQQYHAKTDLNSKILYFTAIINTGNENLFDFKFSIVNSNEHTFLRQKAIWGLDAKTDSQISTKKATLVSILMDAEEDHVTRVYALDALIMGESDPTMFGKIITLLYSDPSYKFRSHIYAILKAHAEPTRRTKTKNVHDYIKNALKFAEDYDHEMPIHSTLNMKSYFNDKYNYGASDELLTVPDGKSALPRDVLFCRDITLFGYTFFFTELLFSSGDAAFHEEYLALFTQNIGLLPGYSLVTDDLVWKTIKKFNFTSGFQRHGPFQFYHALLSKYIYVGDDVEQLIHSLFPLIGEMNSKPHNIQVDAIDVNYVNVELIRPNALGMPVYLTIDIPATNHLRAHIPLKTEDDVIFSIPVDAYYGFEGTIHAKFYVHSILFGDLGYELQTDMGIHLPIKGSIDYDWGTKKSLIRYFTSPEPHEVFHFKSTPKTFEGDHQLPIQYSSQTVQKEYHYGHWYLGAGLTFNVTYDPIPGGYRKFVSSFFKKYQERHDLISLVEGEGSLWNYAVLNPTGKPFALNVIASRCITHPPTTEFQLEPAFTPVKKDFGDFKKHSAVVRNGFSAILTAKGPQERRWELNANASFQWPQMNNLKLKTHFKRTPIPWHDTQPLEVCFNSENQITKDYWKIFNHESVDIKQESTNDLKWGETCSKDVSTVNLKITVEKSEEQKNVDTSKLSSYKKCKELAAKGFVLNYDCWKLILDLGRLDQVTHDYDYDINPKHKNGTSAFFRRLKLGFRHGLYDNLYVDYSTGSGKPNHLEIMANFSYFNPNVMDMKAVHEFETAYYNNIHVPNNKPYTVAEPYIEQLAKKYFNYRKPLCILSGNYIDTFDGLTYETQLKDCHYLAFSEHYWNKTFVYFRAVKTKQYTMAVKFYLDQHVVDFVPNDETIEASVDGQKILEGDIHSFYLPPADDPNDSSFLEIFKLGKGYLLLSERHGIQFYFSGRDSYIKVSHLYRGKQQGLCGNLDGEPLNDFQGPDGTDYQDAASFAASYAVEDNCK